MPGTAHSGGNQQKTVAQHKLDGTYRKDRHAELRTPEPPPGRPEMPEGLSEVGQAEWARMLTRLEASQTLTTVDDGVLEQHCRLYQETEAVAVQQSDAQASAKVLEENLGDVKGMSAADRIALFTHVVELQKIISKCTDQLRSGRALLRQYLVECGLTPASRSRIKLPKPTEDVDEFTKFQKGPIQ